MRQILFATAVLVLTTAVVATAQDVKPARPAQPRAVQPKFVQPRAGMVTAARMAQLEEDYESLVAHRDVKRAYVQTAEVGVRLVEVSLKNTKRLADQKVVSQSELDKATLEVEMAKAQMLIRQAELKEVEVKVKFAKKRLDDAKAAGVRPVPVDPRQ